MFTGNAKVSAKGWVVIPKRIREEMAIQPGDEVRFFLLPAGQGQTSLQMVKVAADVRALRGKYRRDAGERSLTEDLLEERRLDREREERKIGRRPARQRRAG